MSETIEQSAKRAWIEVATLREQVEKLTKERDDLRSRRCEVCGYLEHEREHTGCLREQLAAIAEQNKKMRSALTEAMGWNWLDEDVPPEIGKQIDDAFALQNLATPVLNETKGNK